MTPAGRELDLAVHTALGLPVTEWDVADARGDTKGLRMEHGRHPTKEECERYAALPYGVERGLRAVPIVPMYSEEIDAVWQVVEHWKNDSWSFDAETHEGRWGCWTVKVGKFESKADTFPLAVCHASLAAAEWLASLSPDRGTEFSVQASPDGAK